MSLENSIFQNAISYFLFKNFCFTFRCTANLWTVHADRIARVLKTSGATQTVVLDISKAFYRAWHTGLLYKIMLYGFIKRCFILLSHFVLVKGFELFWSISHIPSVPLTPEWSISVLIYLFFSTWIVSLMMFCVRWAGDTALNSWCDVWLVAPNWD